MTGTTEEAADEALPLNDATWPVATYLAVCAVAGLLPTLIAEDHIGLPRLGGPDAVLTACVLLVHGLALALLAGLGALCIKGRHLPGALLLVVAMAPAGVGIACSGYGIALQYAFAIHTALDPVAALVMGVRAYEYLAPAAIGLGATASALLVILVAATLAHCRARRRPDLRGAASTGDSSGRVAVTLIFCACTSLWVLFVHGADNTMFGYSDDGGATKPHSFVLWGALALFVVASGLLSTGVPRYEHIVDERERGRLWRQAGVVPVAMALMLTSFEASRLLSVVRRTEATWVTTAFGPPYIRHIDLFVHGGRLNAVVLLITGCVPLWLAADARRSGLKTVGVSFFLSVACVVLFVGGLHFFGARLVDFGIKMRALTAAVYPEPE